MIKFNKGYKTKIIAITVSITLLFTGVLYSAPSRKEKLRIPIGMQSTYERMEEFMPTDPKRKFEKSFSSLLPRPLLPALFSLAIFLFSGSINAQIARNIDARPVIVKYSETKIDSLKQELKDKEIRLQELKEEKNLFGLLYIPGYLNITPYYRGEGLMPGINLSYRDYIGDRYRFGIETSAIGDKLGDVEAKFGTPYLGGIDASYKYVTNSSLYPPQLKGMQSIKLQKQIWKNNYLTLGHMILPNTFYEYGYYIHHSSSTLSYINLERDLEEYKEKGWGNLEGRITLGGEVILVSKEKQKDLAWLNETINKDFSRDSGMDVFDLSLTYTYLNPISSYLKLRFQPSLILNNIGPYQSGDLINSMMLSTTLGPVSLLSGIKVRSSNVEFLSAPYLYQVDELFIPFGMNIEFFGGSLTVEGDYLPKTKGVYVDGRYKKGPIWAYLSRNPALFEGVTAGLGLSVTLGKAEKEKPPEFYHYYNRGTDIREGMPYSIRADVNKELTSKRFDYFGKTVDDVIYNFRKYKWSFQELSMMSRTLEYSRISGTYYSPAEVWTKGSGNCIEQATLLAKIMREGMGLSTAQRYEIHGISEYHDIAVAVGENGYGRDGYVTVVDYNNIYFTDVKYEGYGSFTRAVNLIRPNLLRGTSGLSFTGAILQDIMSAPIFNTAEIARQKEIFKLEREIEIIKHQIEAEKSTELLKAKINEQRFQNSSL